ncbi:Rho termination factor N-terminal domain-containing protein [Streptomyces bobili]|uniref:Rho termination factor N-terminal domain-containing protein n=1 Tax=Streptomyces bobili TaxID=67280 RepID=UPI0033A2EAA4
MAKESRSDNAPAEHDDRRTQEKREKYGDMANMTVDELQRRAEERGVKGRSGMRKEELLDALSDDDRK